MLTTQIPKPGPERERILDRFFDKIEPVDDGHLLWIGARQKNGYGKFSIFGKTELAHRVSFAFLHDAVPVEIDHLCFIRECVNPYHMRDVGLDHRSNLRRGDGIAAINAAKHHCPVGHEYTSKDTYYSTSGSRKCAVCVRARIREANYRLGKICPGCKVTITDRSKTCVHHRGVGH